MPGIREYLNTKRDELDAKLAPLTAKRDELRKELATVEEAAREIIVELTEVDTALSALIASDQEERNKPPRTIKKAVLAVLKHHPNGLTSGEILREINTRYFDGSVKRESLSPQLTRLKRDDNKIDLKGDRWVRLHDEGTLFATKS